MRKIFLDVGANKGQNIRNFRKLYGDEYEIFSFEPNPQCISHIKAKYALDEKVTIMECAAWNTDGARELELGRVTVSSTLRDDKTSHMSGNKIIVETLDISKWIRKNFSPDDEIIMYVDVEGAEYEILEKMISDDILNTSWFNKIYMEFHEKKLRNLDINLHNKLYAFLIETFKDDVFIHAKYQHELYEKLG